ncbi:family 16 glycosylhydrolase [Spirillospora sp. CA-294931]|uniref:family 16 glycosylhydrolase n=1 Tax=Spirillospora sp. CA-294931 TaxID=3240042 RepID=UPI003D8B734A
MPRRFRAALTGLLLSASLLAPIPAAVPASAAEPPPNPPSKDGYTLDFQEEFNGTSLDQSKWLPKYLPHWTSTPENAKARYTVADGVLTERLDADTPAWNAKWDSTVKISSIQSYNKDWWHKFNASMPNDHHEPDFNGYTTKYGYFEVRAKMANVGGGGHQAFWLVGTDDTSSASANPEIDMIETFFSRPANWRIAGYGWGDPNFLGSWYSSDQAVPSGEPTKEFHNYGMEWTPTQLKFYYDGQLYRTIDDAPNMPMGMILGIYTDAGSGQHNDVWPKTWNVDYVRVYKKNGGYPEPYQRIKNRQTGQYMYADGGKVRCGAVPATQQNAQWARETTSDGYVRYKNRATGGYLNIENLTGTAEVTTVPTTYWSAQWKESTTDGRTRLQNRWKNTHFLHTEQRTGFVQHGDVPSTYWTSQWTFEP